MNVVDDKIFHVGETGIAHSKIAPLGTARFGDWMGEVPGLANMWMRVSRLKLSKLKTLKFS